MKKIIAILLMICMCMGLCACGDASETTDCEVLIRRIGQVTIDSGAIILEAEKAYEALSEKEKKELGDQAEELRLARQKYDQLLEQTYDEAVTLYNQNRHQDALDIFEKIATYSDSVSYISLCVTAISAREHFEGTWRWVEQSIFNTDLMSNDVYASAWNPYDSYVIDFDAQTITLKFKSSTTEFEEVSTLEILSPVMLRCLEFRDDKDDYLYLHYQEDGVVITKGSADYLDIAKAE